MIRVLIVDDQRLIRRGLALILEDAPEFEVVGEAENGAEALVQVERLRPDVVLMDLIMPVMDGVTATQRICTEFEQVKVLVLTIDDDDEYITQALRFGAAGYLLKNTPPDELVQALQLVSKGYTQLGPGLGRKLAAQIPAPTPTPAVWATLTPREQEIVRLIGEGLNNDEIAERLVIAKSTVKNHVTRILQRLNMRDRTEVAIFATRLS